MIDDDDARPFRQKSRAVVDNCLDWPRGNLQGKKVDTT